MLRELIHTADMALYTAKHNGRNQVSDIESGYYQEQTLLRFGI